MTVVAEVGDVARFAKLAQVVLVGRVDAAGPQLRHHRASRPVSKMGSPALRWVLGEAAQVAKRKAPYAATFKEIAARRGRNVATTAIARRLLARCFHVLRDVEQQRRLLRELVGSSGELELFLGHRTSGRPYL